MSKAADRSVCSRDPERLDLSSGQTITIGFKCVNNCLMCLVGDLKNSLKPVTFHNFKEFIDRNKRTNKFDRLIISGAECTLEKKFLRYIDYAKKSSAYKHIRIQTNALAFRDLDFARKTVAAGVDEFYVSFNADNPRLSFNICRRRESFRSCQRPWTTYVHWGPVLSSTPSLFPRTISSCRRLP